MLRVWIRRIVKVSIPLVLGLVLFIWYCNNWIDKACDAYIFSSVEEIPRTEVGLLLGTSKYNRSGNPNQFFRYRIDAAVKLYFNRKVKYLLVSGDNRTLYYNEPRDMRRALIARGVPDSVIFLDYAGLRTFDSVIRCNKVFGQSSFTIISQEFHLERALFIAQYFGLHVIGFEAQAVAENRSVSTVIREYFARFKAVLDVYVLGTKPKFLGDPIQIGKGQ
jgi:SanA protein